MKHLAILAAVLALAGCDDWTLDGRIDGTEAAKIEGAITMIEGQRLAWNAAGYDPLRVSAPVLSLASMGCGSLAMAGALRDPGIGQTVMKVCDAVLRIAGPAADKLTTGPTIPEAIEGKDGPSIAKPSQALTFQ